MSVILSLLGIAVAAAGVAAIGFGIPINEFTLGTTLIVAGVGALTGGLVLIGLGAVVAELGRLSETIRTRLVVRPQVRAEAPELAQPAPAPANLAGAPVAMASTRPAQPAPARARSEAAQAPQALDISAAAAERSQPSRAEQAEPSIIADEEEVPLSPLGVAHLQTRRPRPVEGASPEPKAASEEGGSAVEALKASRLDFLFRSKPARSASQRENFDAVWPADTRPGRRAENEASPPVEADQRQAEAGMGAEDRAQQSVTLDEPRAAAILKSGVVDGMAYTLYTDGSIEAKLPHGTVKFGSIAELRAYIESNS
jgi:hypothetical protein